MPADIKQDGAWVQAVTALTQHGLSEPGLLVFILSHCDVVLPTGKSEPFGGVQRALAAVAAALGMPRDDVQAAYIARISRRSEAAKVIAEAKAALPTFRAALPDARVGEWKTTYFNSPTVLVYYARYEAKHGTASLPPPRSSPEWMRLFYALREHRAVEAEVLSVLARFRTVKFASGVVAEPLEEDDAYLTVAEALRLSYEVVRNRAERSFGAATLSHGPNFAGEAIELEPELARLPGVASVERVTGERAVVAKRTIDGGSPEAPWEAFPEDPTSLRWRMGPGEDFMDSWQDYWASLGQPDREVYLAEHAPPTPWREWLDGWRAADPTAPARKINFYEVGKPFGYLSNFARAPITLDGRIWPTSEHYFQAQKFSGRPEEEQVRLAPTPFEAARLGRSLSGLRVDWDQVKDDVMLAALRAKFAQHPYLRSELLATGDAILVERTRNDSYWADGGDGSGRNRLGELLMEVRSELRRREPT